MKSFLSPETVERPRLNRNKVQEILRIRKQPFSIGPLRLANPEADDQKINKLSQQIAEGSIAPSEILLTTGMGLSAKSQDIPIRLPSLLIPGLHMMRTFKDQGFAPPRYLVYQATDFIAEMNGIERSKAQGVSQRMKKYLEQFIADAYPDLKDQVILEFGISYEAPIKAIIEAMAGEIRASIQAIPELAEIVQDLEKCEEQHSARKGSSLQYAAANILYNGGKNSAYPFANTTQPKAILPIGGKAEQPFFTLTSHFSGQEETPVIPLLTHIGSRPTYYPYPTKSDPVRPEDISFTTKHPDGPIQHDLEALKAIEMTQERIKQLFPTS